MENIKLLLVEDEPIVQKVHSCIIKRLGYGFDLAENGNKAMELAENNKYSLIFMDVGLPDYTGMYVTGVIRCEGLNSKTPIVVLTGYQNSEIKMQCLEMGATEVYTKPVDVRQIQKIIESYITK